MSGVAVWLAAGALGAAGAVGRFALDTVISARARAGMPWGILTVNVLGSAALGVLAGVEPGSGARFLLAGGLLGSFTTFSTWMLDSRRLVEAGRRRAALLNLALSAGLGLAALTAGLTAVSLLEML